MISFGWTVGWMKYMGWARRENRFLLMLIIFPVSMYTYVWFVYAQTWWTVDESMYDDETGEKTNSKKNEDYFLRIYILHTTHKKTHNSISLKPDL